MGCVYMIFQNEILIAASVVLFFGGLVLLFRMFGKTGVYVWIVLETVCANIEVLILVRAFGMEMTLGNVLFASSFLATDILSEVYGKKEADKAVWVGIASNIAFIIISQMWMLYIPSSSDTMAPAIKTVFAHTPRIMLASLASYCVCELFDVWCYHKWWNLTARLSNDTHRFLWLRNNLSTLAAQLLNTVMFTALAFYGVYEFSTLVSIAVSSYIIFIFTSLLDTPFVYWARWLAENRMKLVD